MSHAKKGDKTMQVERIGLDIAKSSFQVHGVDAYSKAAGHPERSSHAVNAGRGGRTDDRHRDCGHDW